MKSLHRFWRTLESIPNLAAVPAEWQHLLGEDYRYVKSILRPTGQVADSFPVLERYEFGGMYSVAHHGPDDHVGVCHESGDTITLTAEDLIVYELNGGMLRALICEALRIEVNDETVVDIPKTYRLGNYVPLAMFRYPVFLTIQHVADDLASVVDRLIATTDKRFIVLTPTRTFIKSTLEQRIREARGMILSLNECVDFLPTDGLVISPAGVSAFDDFKASDIPDPVKTKKAIEPFPTPAGTTWSDISMRFTDGHTVLVRIGDLQRQVSYAEMGMVDSRNKKPTRQWELLRLFERYNGVITPKSDGAHPKIKKQRQLLAKTLEGFFGLNGPSFDYVDGGWRTVFTIAAE